MALKLPESSSGLSLYPGEVPEATYPPLGFLGVADGQLGNGDIFGLYWPIGRETSDPIVCETFHDAWSIMPWFSSIEAFVAAAPRFHKDDLDEDDGDEYEDVEDDNDPIVSIELDPRSPFANFERARTLLKTGDVAGAITHLETALAVLPEYTAASALICSQYRRVGRNDDAMIAGHRMLISPPCFGRADSQILGWLSRQKSPPEALKFDPIWSILGRLKWKFGGEKQNDDYLLLSDSIEAYLQAGKTVEALTLMQSYGEYMGGETVSFKERYDFTPAAWIKKQIEVSEKQHACSRLPNFG